MLLIKSFLFCGLVCLCSQLVLDNTKLTPGHITSILVVLGSFLDCFNIYDKIIEKVGGAALIPITSFGHSLVHGSLLKANSQGIVGIFSGMFDLTATGISFSLFFAFVFSLLFRPKN